MLSQFEFIDSSHVQQELKQAPMFDRMTTEAFNELILLDQQMNQLIKSTKRACELEAAVSEKDHQMQQLERLNTRIKRRDLLNMQFTEQLRAGGLRDKGRIFESNKVTMRMEDDESVRIAFMDPQYIHDMLSNSNFNSANIHKNT